ncbi:hypothetical protein F5146DRAFT_1225329, partial [Armillaria mellea]
RSPSSWSSVVIASCFTHDGSLNKVTGLLSVCSLFAVSSPPAIRSSSLRTPTILDSLVACFITNSFVTKQVPSPHSIIFPSQERYQTIQCEQSIPGKSSSPQLGQ